MHDSGQRSWHILLRIVAHPCGTFYLRQRLYSHLEIHFLLLTTYRSWSLLDSDKKRCQNFSWHWITMTYSYWPSSSSQGGWPGVCFWMKSLRHFNSHPHEEDDNCSSMFSIASSSFQLTSSRRGWHRPHPGIIGTANISTHILTRRMTYIVIVPTK